MTGLSGSGATVFLPAFITPSSLFEQLPASPDFLFLFYLPIGALLFILVSFSLIAWWIRKSHRSGRKAVRPLAPVLNGGEKALYERLQQLVAGRPVNVFAKIRVIDVIQTTQVQGLSSRERQYSYTAHFDFLLVDANSMMPLVAVELDGSIHQSDGATQRRDAMKDRICQLAGLPLLRVRFGKWEALEQIQQFLPR